MGKKIGPWPLGMDVLSPEDSMPKDQDKNVIAARDAVNVDFDRTGSISSRPGLQLALDDQLDSLWTRRDGSASYARHGLQLALVTRSGDAVMVEDIAPLPSAQPLDFCELNDEVVFSSVDTIGIIGFNGVRPFSVPDASTPQVVPNPVGGLYAGRYSVAISWLDATGAEGALSPLATVAVPEGGGIRLTLPTPPDGVTLARIYRTGQNGDKLYQVSDAPAAMGSFLVGTGQRGREADTDYLRALPPGRYVRNFKGWMISVRGRVLYFSDPLRFGLYSPRHGFVAFPQVVTFLEVVEGGIFVGQRDTVLFLDGNRPGDWQVRHTGAMAPIRRTSALIPGDHFDPSLQLNPGDHAVWLAINGYVLGTPTGQVVEPQSRRIRVPFSASGRTAVFNRRLFTFTD